MMRNPSQNVKRVQMWLRYGRRRLENSRGSRKWRSCWYSNVFYSRNGRESWWIYAIKKRRENNDVKRPRHGNGVEKRDENDRVWRPRSREQNLEWHFRFKELKWIYNYLSYDKYNCHDDDDGNGSGFGGKRCKEGRAFAIYKSMCFAYLFLISQSMYVLYPLSIILCI